MRRRRVRLNRPLACSPAEHECDIGRRASMHRTRVFRRIATGSLWIHVRHRDGAATVTCEQPCPRPVTSMRDWKAVVGEAWHDSSRPLSAADQSPIGCDVSIDNWSRDEFTQAGPSWRASEDHRMDWHDGARSGRQQPEHLSHRSPLCRAGSHLRSRQRGRAAVDCRLAARLGRCARVDRTRPHVPQARRRNCRA